MISEGVGYRGEKRRKRAEPGRGGGREHQSIGYIRRPMDDSHCVEVGLDGCSRRGIDNYVEIKERRRKVINAYYELISRSIRNEAKHIHVMPLSRLERALIRPLIMSRLNISLHRCLFRIIAVCVG